MTAVPATTGHAEESMKTAEEGADEKDWVNVDLEIAPGKAVAVPAPAASEAMLQPEKQRSGCLGEYIARWAGRRDEKTGAALRAPAAAPVREWFWSWLGALIGITLLAEIHYHLLLEDTDLALIIGSFGATAILLYGVPQAPLAQPRNCLGGHVLSAVVGVGVRKLLVDLPGCPDCRPLACGLAVSVALFLMHATRTVHPPGGATALIAVIASTRIQDLGFAYVLVPVGLGAALMILVALLVNNLSSQRPYPVYWW